jgi:hypothetical protein
MHDPEHEDDPILVDPVEHDAVVADPEPVERVGGPANRLHCLAAGPPRVGRILPEPFESLADSPAQLGGEPA